MEKTQGRTPILHRVIAILLAFVLVAGYFPTTSGWKVSAAEPGAIDTVADPETLTRPTTIYGSNTLNAGKVTVGKSVATHEDTVKLGNNDQFSFTAEENNFIVTISQFAQVMGLTSETTVPVDVVFVLDTSGSMGKNNTNNKTGRAEAMVNAANSAIATLLSVNEHNRVAVVAFSSEGYGSGTSNDNAANLLSPLYHYTGNSATKHLQWVNSSKTAYTGSTTNTTSTSFGVGSNYNLIAGRNQQGSANGTRDGGNGGTNIQAGIALGAQQLTSVTDTTVTYEDGTTVTRMPFIVLLSDGAPTFSSSIETWYTPSQTAEQGPGSSSYAGNGFLTALTAAYYKGAVTEHYYGSNADSNNRCSIYTIGVMLDSLSENNGDRNLAEVTMNPKQHLGDTTNTFANEFTSYWNSYKEGNGDFNVLVNYTREWRNTGTDRNPNWQQVDVPIYYSIRANTIAATANYVNGKNANGETMYTGGIVYNDGHYNATQTSEIAAIFQDVVNEIQMKAISSPTQVSTEGANFSGYVHFSDPIGEYMEVRDMKGIVLGDQFYSGATFAELLKGYGANNATQKAFDQMLRDVLDQRMRMSGSRIDAAEFVADALASHNQANYTNDNNFDNSIVWWGSDYTSGNGQQLQVLAHADDDSVEYIEKQETAGKIPTGAKYVCRSYFFYGNSAEDHEFMYFMLRVQRSLEAPYQQTVVISCPASLLSMEKVLITEESDGTYTASVTSASPARVVYEVGLRSDINAQNVDQMVNDIYREESVTGTGSVNYSNGAYNFFTNDWDRSQSNSSHHRAMTEASFEAAADNSFYTYQQDTLLLDASGRAVTGTVTAGNYYYVREYYDWTGKTPVNGSYSADKKTQLIKVEIDDPSILKQSGNNWYIPKGAYTASTLETTGDDILKDDPNTVEDENITGTSAIVSHAHRTGSINDNHYAVALGNNGMLTLVADPPKSVSIGNNTTNDDGKTVMVGEKLTYKVKVVNNEGAAATAVVTDVVPTGTQLVAGSISHGGSVDTDNKITWNLNLDADPDRPTIVSFEVVVLPEALAGEQNVQNITNTATIQIGNNPSYKTNTVTNPPEGKKVVVDAEDSADGVQVGDTLTFRVRYYNDTNAEADVTVIDKVPNGTTFVKADHNGTLNADGNVVWIIENVQPGRSGVVSFEVKVDASAAKQPGDSDITIRNNASFQIGENGPWQQTNTTETKVETGNVAVKKVVANAEADKQSQSFTVRLSEDTGKLNGSFMLSGSAVAQSVTFTNGVSNELTILHNETLTVHDLPEGVIIYVQETGLNAMPGWSAVYTDNDGGQDPQRVVVIADNPLTPEEEIRQITITNTYRVSPVIFKMNGVKAFSGANFPAGRFTFKAQLADENGIVKTGADAYSVNVVLDHTGGEDLDVSFELPSRTFTKVETRYYLIDESAIDIPGVTTSTKQYLLKLDIKDVDAQLVADAAIKARDDSTAWDTIAWNDFNWANESVSFTNTYKPKAAEVAIDGEKILKNRYLQNGEFSFELINTANNQIVSTAKIVNDGTDHKGTFAFEKLIFTTAGTYTYHVKEVDNKLPNITTYDNTLYIVEIVVVDNVATGMLEPTVTYYKGSVDSANVVKDISFTNTFTSPGTYTTFTGTKNLIGAGADGLTAGEFSFSIFKSNEHGEKLGGQYLGGSNAEDKDPTGGYSVAINFARIDYKVADMIGKDGSGNDVILSSKDFYYVVEENAPTVGEPTFNPNTYYSPVQYLVKVTVSYDAATGAMAVASTDVINTKNKSDANWPDPAVPSTMPLVFENIQHPATVEVKPEAKKTTLTQGGTAAPMGLSFSFTVINAATNTEAGVGVSQATDGTPNAMLVDFTNLVFSAPGVYKFWIQESNTAALNGVTCDPDRYLMVITIGRDAENKLVPLSTVYYNAGLVTDSKNVATYEVAGNIITTSVPEFGNTYEAAGHLNITAQKVLKNSGGTAIALDGREFDFKLERLQGLTLDSGVVAGSEIAGIHDADGNISFATLNYSTADFTDLTVDTTKVIAYRVSEIEPNVVKIPGITYDTTPRIIFVKLTHVASSAEIQAVLVTDETGSTEIAPDSTTGAFPSGVVFENKYVPINGTEATITAKKTLSGRDLEEKEFGFRLYHGMDTSGTLVASATNALDGSISFTRVYPSTMSRDFFTNDGDGNDETATLIYHLVEVNDSIGGIRYSGAKYWIKVVVGHDSSTASLTEPTITYYSDAAMTVEVPAAEVVFANTYTAEGATYTPVGHKVLVEKEMTDGQFRFEVIELELETGTWVEKGAVSTGSNAAADKNAAAPITFAPIGYNFNQTGHDIHSHYYKIVETPSTDDTITVDPTVYYLKVTIIDDKLGNLRVKSAEYYVGNDADSAINNSSPFYTETFYQYDETNHQLTDVRVDGKPVIGGTETDPATFTNHYGPGYVNINLELDKVVQLVNTNEYDMQDGQFDFTVYETNGTPVTYGTNVDDGDSDLQKDKIVFGSITIQASQVGQTGPLHLVYKITEDVPSDAAVKGIEVDTNPIFAHVTVVNDGYGNLSPSVVYRTGEDPTSAALTDPAFTNTYTAKPVNFNIVAHKHLSGKHLADKEFQFKLYNVDAAGNETAIATMENNATGEVVFQMRYDQVGTYVYLLKETGKGSGAVDGEYGFDNHYYKITIVVADDTEGNLFVQSADKIRLENTTSYSLRAPGLTYVAGMDFYNTYKPNPISINLNVEIDAQKLVVDAEGNIREDLTAGFEFRVLDIRNKPVFTDAQGDELFAKSNANGEIVLPNFQFTEAGEYHYWMFEKDVAEPFTKDSAVYEIHILVHQNTSAESLQLKDENGNVMETVAPGALYIVRSEVMTFSYSEIIGHTDDTDEDKVVFTNQYKPDPVTVTISANKILTGRDMKAGEFNFHLVEEVGGNHIIRAEVHNDADGNVNFTMTYVTDGEHTYSIHEHVPTNDQKAGGVTYDGTNYRSITVKVVRDGEKLIAKVGDKTGTSFSSGVTITNKYTAKPVTAVVEAVKLLEGGLTLKADDFTFQLKDEEGNVVATAKNDVAGKIKFEIPFQHKDLGGEVSKTFAYTIHEVKGEIPGIVYDESAFKAFVTVTDDLNGNLNYSTSYETGTLPTFVNVYETDDAVVTIKASKKLNGNTLKGEDFLFVLRDKDGKDITTAKNDKDGNIIFNFTVAEAGEYTYIIAEKAGEDGHISYDSNSYEITVAVEDNGEGKLLAKDPVYKTEDGKVPVFINTYTPDGIKVTVEASKQFTGKTLKADEFTFQLLDEEGKEVASAKNTVDGKISFQLDIDAEGTYVYTMVEKAGDNAQITYDAAKYKVTIKVTNVDGVLTPVVTYETEDGKAPVFQNTWKPEKIGITLTGTKTLTGRDMKAGEFKFQVHDSTGTLVATGTNDAKGKITFTPVGIVTKGTYLLTVSEVQGTAEYVTYDKATFQVKVVVENVDGVLVPTVTYPDGDIAFENSYDEPANPETGDNSPIYWMIGLLVISALAIVLLIALRPKKKGGKYAK